MEYPIYFNIYNLEKYQAVKLQCSHTICNYCINFSKKFDNTFRCPQCAVVTNNVNSVEIFETIKRILIAKSKNIKIDEQKNQTSDDMFFILIRNLNNRSFEIKVNKNETVAKLKDLINEVEGVEPKTQWLLYNEISMQDEKKLKEYCIMNGHIVSLVLS
ncbi:hypothetical protein SteCoe_38962 [Stentor coeruleus]|uniref:Ubiquitin-like domain-containing protein n=1 Tax=Stentor coeruleus TaxID=5963 RepID=A0A1R2AKW8_9CILI|nr:hypothetical protein SteCoe_38962 [Stentor coeruleus]